MPRQILCWVWLTMFPAIAYGQSISAVWDPNPPQDGVTSYEVCVSTTPLSCNVRRANVPAGEARYDFVPTPGVLYRVAVRAVNDAAAGQFSPEVVASIPSLAQPANQTSTANVAISPLSLSASDPDGSALQFTHSGLPFGLSLNSGTGVITGIPTSPGTFNVTVFVSDLLETTSRSFVWTVQPGGGTDTTAPALSVSSHTSGQTVATSSITLAGTASDSGRGGSGITGVTVNGASAPGGTATDSNTASWSLSVPLATGSNTLTVVATDGAANARTTTLTINRTAPADTTAPTLSITSHSPGQTVNTSSITLSGTATDSGSGGSGITSVTVNGSSASGGTASGTATANWSRSVPLTIGANPVTVVATDGAGNQRTFTLTINWTPADTTAPTLTITSHTSNQTLSTTTITLSGMATDSGTGGSGISSVTVNGSPASGGTTAGSNTASWSRTLTLAAGPNVITVVATDGAGNVRTAPITLVAPTPVVPMASARVTANLTSPQAPGTAVTLSGGGSGGTAPYSFKWWVQKDGGAWTMLEDWSTSPVTWTPSQSGSYVVGVWGRSSGASADVAQAVGTLPFVIATAASTPTPSAAALPSPGTAMTYASLSANATGPTPSGTPVTFTADGTGGLAPYAFKWWVQKDGGIWTMLQDWSTSATWTWTPTQSGTYVIGVWGRSADTTIDRPQAIATASTTITATTTSVSPSVLRATITSSVASPRLTGTTVAFSTSVTGGTAPYSFKYWIQRNGGVWTLARDWSTDATWNWTPGQTGNYVIGVWVRSAGAILDVAQAVATVPFAISSGSSMTGSSLVANASSARVGASVTLTASGTGGIAPYSFRWWVQKDGGAWTDMSAWSSSQEYRWTPSAPGNYIIAIWGRSAGATADTPQTVASTSVVILP